MKERETNEERQIRLLPSHFGNGTSYRLARQLVNDRNRHAEQHEGPREGVSPVSINITLFGSTVAVIIIYAIANTY